MARLGVRALRGARRPRRPARGRRRDRALAERGVDLSRCSRRPTCRRRRRCGARGPGLAARRRARLAADRRRAAGARATATPVERAVRDPQRRPHRRRHCSRTRDGGHGRAGLPAGDDPHRASTAPPASRSAPGSRPGSSSTLVGDANDYVGKGLSGGVLVVRPPADAGFRRRGERDRRQHRPLRGDGGQRVLPRPRRRALRRPQLGRERRRRGGRRPRLRVHDRRHASSSLGPTGPQLRRRDERRHRLRARRGRPLRARCNTSSSASSRSRTGRPRRCARSWRSTATRTGSRGRRARCSASWESARRGSSR